MADAVTAPSRAALVRAGTVVWLASEVMFFGALFAAYFTLRPNATDWPPAGAHLDTMRAGAFSLVLVASSVTAQAGLSRGIRRWFVVTALLGLVFLGNQALEWRDAGFAPSDGAYGSMYYLMTGFHGLHVAAGVVALLAVAARPVDTAAHAIGYYWHFVDVVWLALFATLFLIR